MLSPNSLMSPVNMSFSSLFKKASNLLGLGSPETLKPPPLDGEIIYCKNNVCVHPPAILSTDVEHYPGYLNIRSQDDQVLGSTLILTWIPNTTLKKNPRSIENSPNRPGGRSPRVSPRRSPRQEFAKPIEEADNPQQSPEDSNSSNGSLADKRGSAGKHGHLSAQSSTESPEEGYGSLKTSHIKQENMKNNAKNTHDHTKVPGVGKNVNHIHHKNVNVDRDTVGGEAVEGGDTSSPSSDSGESPSTERQLFMLLHRTRLQERVKERTSSGRSVTSIEMEGDNLVVVTEEVDDNAFAEPGEQPTDGTTIAETGSQSTDGATGSVVRVTRHRVSENGGVDSGVGDGDDISASSDSTYPSPTGDKYHKMLAELQADMKQKEADEEIGSGVVGRVTQIVDADGGSGTLNAQRNGCHGQTLEQDCAAMSAHSKPVDVGKLKESLDLKLQLDGAVVEPPMLTPDISITGSPGGSSSSGSTSGPDSRPPTPITPPDSLPGSVPHTPGQVLADPSYHNLANNMQFPNNSVSYGYRDGGSTPGSEKRSVKEQICGVFSVDIGQMRSLRIFYNNDACTNGQLVIASRESQYKVLHFHHGGLDRLSEVFDDWKFLAEANKDKRHKDLQMRSKHFSVIRPHLANELSHPEEGTFEMVNEETWKQHMNEKGLILDDYHLRKVIFFAGLDPSLRHEMWPFLLHYYPYDSTFEEREHLRNDKYIEYQNLRKARESMSAEEKEKFWRSVQCTVEKDVVRTDRSHPYFKGEDNPNIEILKNILLHYAVAHPHYGYTQGMSDLLAPVLVEVQHEADAYWCFVGLMQKTIFVSSPKDIDMDKQLLYLKELLRLIHPEFYLHLQKVQDGMELLFVHRWILLCFKREFPESDALRMWEACWSHYQTDYFHLFICVAIICVYGEDVIEQDLPADEMLLHFSSLSMHMSGNVILKKARALLHQFRILPKIPCTVEGLCMLCGPGMWDSGHVPTIECNDDHGDQPCPYGGTRATTNSILPSFISA